MFGENVLSMAATCCDSCGGLARYASVVGIYYWDVLSTWMRSHLYVASRVIRTWRGLLVGAAVVCALVIGCHAVVLAGPVPSLLLTKYSVEISAVFVFAVLSWVSGLAIPSCWPVTGCSNLCCFAGSLVLDPLHCVCGLTIPSY